MTDKEIVYNSLIPELSVSNIDISKKFYLDLGFKIRYERKENKFCFLQLEGNQIMIEENNDNWNTGKLEHPYGRGINLSMTVSNIEKMYEILKEKNIKFFLDLEIHEYRIDDKITVGVLAMFSWKYPCGSCHKLRVSPQGNVSVCLNDKEVIKITDTSLEKKKNIIKNAINKRESIIENNKERKHFRNNLGEFRFGKVGKKVNIDDFYEMLRNGRGRDCNF